MADQKTEKIAIEVMAVNIEKLSTDIAREIEDFPHQYTINRYVDRIMRTTMATTLLQDCERTVQLIKGMMRDRAWLSMNETQRIVYQGHMEKLEAHINKIKGGI